MKAMIDLIGSAAITYGVAVLLIMVFQDRLVYFPSREITRTPEERGLSYTSVRLETRDGVSLNGWLIPHPQSESVVLYCYGNGGNLSNRIGMIELFHEMGLSVFIFDYRGYGKSEGNPSEEGTYLDGDAAWEYLLSIGYKPKNIILYGESLGGAVAAKLVSENKAKGLVLAGSFTDINTLAQEHYFFLPIRLISRYRYPTVEYLQKTDSPVLIVHSTEDKIVPYRYGQELFEKAKEPKTLLSLRGGHNTAIFESEEVFREGMAAFLKGL